MNLKEPAKLYLSINSKKGHPRFGKKYLGFDSKEYSASYYGSSKTLEFKDDKAHMTKTIIAEGTVEEILILEQKVLSRINAAASHNFYNESNGNGFDLEESGITLDYSKVSEKWIKDCYVDAIEARATELSPESSLELDNAEAIIAAAIKYAQNPDNVERTLVGLIYSKLENAEEDVQTRDELIDKRYVDAVADLMRDERRNGQDPGESAKTKPIILVDDKLVNGHHTICALHKIGWERCKIVKMSLEEHFAGDWDIVETFGEAINPKDNIQKLKTKQDCIRSIDRNIRKYLNSKNIPSDDKHALQILRNEPAAKKYIRKMVVDISQYTTSTFDAAWGDLEKELSLNKKLIELNKTIIPFEQIKRVIGETRDELGKRLALKYNNYETNQFAKGKLTMGDIGNAHSAAIRVLSDGVESCVLVLHHDTKSPALEDDDRDRILRQLKKDLLVGRTEVPNIHIVILPLFDGDSLYQIHAKDIS